jgi:nucleoside-diphosphate-sugar epimerase
VVLITGATGFVGRHLLPSLPPGGVRLAVRSGHVGSVPGCESVCVEDVNRSTDWRQAVAGARCVVHMAAHAHVMHPSADDRSRFHEVNALGTERLAIAAANAGVKRFIYLSSIKVNGEATSDRPFTATDAPHPGDDYGVSKWEAEQRLFRVAADYAMEAVVVRPTLIYGPGVRGNFLTMMSWVHKGVPLPFASIANARSLLNVWNLCSLIGRMVELAAVPTGVYLAADGVDLSTPELIRRLAMAMGRPARLLPVPAAVLNLLGALTAQGPSIRRLCNSLTVDIGSTVEVIGWAPRVSIDEALALTARWYVNHI